MIPLYGFILENGILIQCILSEDNLCLDCYYRDNKVYFNEIDCPGYCFIASRPEARSVIYKEIDCICL